MAARGLADGVHFGPGSPVAGAHAWLELVLVERDLRAAWPLTEPEYRRRLVAAWAREAARLRPELRCASLLDALSEEEPDEEAEWAAFADAQLRDVARVCRYVDLTGSGWASRPQAEWAAFADAQLRDVARVCRYVDLTGSGWASRPQAESPGCELVVLAEAGELHGLEEPPSLPAYALLMRHDVARGWRVAELR